MEVTTAKESRGPFGRAWLWIKALPMRFIDKVVDIGKSVKKLARDDPRRVVHSMKVGLALTLVSLFYYFQPIFDNFGVTAMWAVMTVVVVFEFSVGATLSKGLNRGMATLVAGVLGVGAHHLSSLCGRIGEPILLGIFVFILASASTFVRFFPHVKARYDYGCLIFILTFSLVSVSGFRDDEIIELAHKRLSTIMIGVATCVIISMLVWPVWAGLDLHNLISLNLDKLANFLQGFGEEYFRTEEDGEPKNDKTFLQGYKRVLNSKSTEESLANFARWEPGHGQFKFRHPWKQYLKIGALTRQCAYRIDALNTYLSCDVQAPKEIKIQIQETCTKMSFESGKALKELSSAVKNMTQPSSVRPHIANAQNSAKNLKTLLKSGLLWKESELLTVIPAATVASLLIDVVNCVDNIAESVYELASLAEFKKEKSQSREAKISDCSEDDHVVITINESCEIVNVSGTTVKNCSIDNVPPPPQLVMCSTRGGHFLPKIETEPGSKPDPNRRTENRGYRIGFGSEN